MVSNSDDRRSIHQRVFVHACRSFADGREGRRTTGPADNTPRCTGIDHLGQRSEFTGKVLDLWAHLAGVKLNFIRPGKPVENSYIESFNGRPRDECLNVEVFLDLADARRKLDKWKTDYNQQRPHRALAVQVSYFRPQKPGRIGPRTSYSFSDSTSLLSQNAGQVSCPPDDDTPFGGACCRAARVFA